MLRNNSLYKEYNLLAAFASQVLISPCTKSAKSLEKLKNKKASNNTGKDGEFVVISNAGKKI